MSVCSGAGDKRADVAQRAFGKPIGVRVRVEECGLLV
jgi:hypothetical protein